MKKKVLLIGLFLLFASCQNREFFKNQTRPGGYAMGENITLKFSTNDFKANPDSIAVFVLEKKTGYRYSLWATRAECTDVCLYETAWNGLKPDGSWPDGGTYFIYAVIDNDGIYSDTIQVGLGD
jgi:hypothetical protein